MATVVNSTPLCSSVSLKNSAFIGNSVGGKFLRVKPVLHTCRFPSLEVKAVDGSNKRTKPNSIVCADCDGNVRQLGSKFLASVLVVHYRALNAKVRELILRTTSMDSSKLVDYVGSAGKGSKLSSHNYLLDTGKREILCGNCNGAGFMGGFMSSFDG
ncbi:hypothetical protein DKX38_028115 [Salix brachista]|uniref:BSD2 cysteine rich domain-containing protein n=2 Tax=Salix TaxID=40685 RepID=A0A5N5J4R3_9ROSI|nr:hypothetical protein DKX38_028115 [Salix brachista]